MTRSERRETLFVLSVNTEGEWDWEKEQSEDAPSLQNTNRLQEFQLFCNKHGIRPTYFFDYETASRSASASALMPFVDSGHCEIGGQLNSWNTPPLREERTEKNTHVIHLPAALVRNKIEALLERIELVFGARPRAFRTGRWDINGPTLNALVDFGIVVDSSMCPYYRDNHVDCADATAKPYWPNLNSPQQPRSQRNILEIPVTAGYNWANQGLANSAHRFAGHSALRAIHLRGVLWRTGLLRKTQLSPELSSVKDQVKLATTLIANRYPLLHMYMHSSSLLNHGKRTTGASTTLETIVGDIESVLVGIKKSTNLTYCTVSEAAALLKQKGTIS